MPSQIAASTTCPCPDWRADELGQCSKGKIERPSPIVADKIERRDGRTSCRADRIECTGNRDIVDVMAGRPGERSVLAPSGHPAIDEPWIAVRDRRRSKTQALHHAGPETLAQDVGALDQADRAFAIRLILEIEEDGCAPAARQIDAGSRLRVRAIGPHNVGAHLGKQHRCERS